MENDSDPRSADGRRSSRVISVPTCVGYTDDVRVFATLRFLIVVALLLLYGCQKRTSPTIFVDPALATLVPTDTIFIAGVRVEQLPTTPSLAIVENFARDSGIDPRKNLWEVIVPSDGKTTWVMLRGKFAEMGMEPRINKEGARRVSYKGYTMQGDERIAVMFLNPTTAVAADPDALRSIIDNREKTTGIPRWLEQQVAGIPASNQAWFAGKLQGTGQVAGGIDFQSGANPRLSVTTKTRAEAQRFAELLRRLFDGVHVEEGGQGGRVNLDIPVQRLNDLISLFSL